MARRKKGDNTAIIYLVIIAIAISAAAVIGPVWLLMYWIISEIRNISFGLRKLVDANPEEIHLLQRCQTQIEENDDEILRLEQTGGSLMRRADGMFDGRDTFGRELNFKIQDIQEFRGAVVTEKSRIEQTILARIEDWADARAKVVCLRLSLITYLVVFLFALSPRPDWLVTLGRFAAFYLAENNFGAYLVIGASLIGIIPAFVVYISLMQTFRQRLISSKIARLGLS